ncbi:MAG: glycosyltransferase family 2 protein [Vicinamibacterales bacterium]
MNVQVGANPGWHANVPTVSVLMTSYNRERYLAEAIDSVLAQTFGDFELIVSDDASTDRTAQIANDYAARDARIRVMTHDRNVGDYANRNRAAGYARGRYLKYHDSDDVMYPHCLSVMVPLLEAEPSAGFALSGSHFWPGGRCPMLLTPALAYEREFLGSGLFHLGPAGALFRTERFRALGGFRETPHASDYLFWVDACLTVDVLLVPGDLFYYRQHAGQEAEKPANALAYAMAAAHTWCVLNSPACPLADEKLRQAKRNFVYTQARGMYRYVRRGQLPYAWQLIRHVGLTSLDWIRYLRPPHRMPHAGTPPSTQEIPA